MRRLLLALVVLVSSGVFAAEPKSYFTFNEVLSYVTGSGAWRQALRDNHVNDTRQLSIVRTGEGSHATYTVSAVCTQPQLGLDGKPTNVPFNLVATTQIVAIHKGKHLSLSQVSVAAPLIPQASPQPPAQPAATPPPTGDDKAPLPPEADK